MLSDPIAFLITFRTYGTWLHGDERGSVDRAHNGYLGPLLPPKPGLRKAMSSALKQQPVTLDEVRRTVVENTIDEVCRYRNWTLHARQARSNHVHVLLSADEAPERIMGTLKSWCTRRLRERGAIDADASIWSRHGSTKYIWDSRSLDVAGRYVAEGQGEELQ